ncbi:MAG: cytochrome c3 family protein [Acidimicrobiia bacterium]|nr:cytochrome c3 family protein [Acidimicrobiia bacterium]
MPRVRWILLAAVTVLMVGANPDGPASAQETDGTDPRWDSETCLECHDGNTATVAFPSGEQLGLNVDGPAYRSAPHAATGVQCVHCHTTIARFPHPEVTAADARAFTVELSKSCGRCHWREFTIRLDQAHSLVASSAGGDLPVCVDCHEPHAARADTLDHPDVQAVCRECHSDQLPEAIEAIHVLDPTRVVEASAPPLILFYALAGVAVMALLGLGWAGVVAVQWIRDRFGDSG